MNTMLSSLSLLTLPLLAVIPLAAEEPTRFHGPQRIATVDLDEAVRKSREYQTKLAGLRDSMAAAKAGRLPAERDELKRLADQAKTFEPGSPEYRAAEDGLGYGKGCGIVLRNEIEKREFDQSATRLFAEVRMKAVAEIAAYAREQQFQLVINSTPSAAGYDGSNCIGQRFPQSSKRLDDISIRSRVIYSSCPDITSTIVERLDAASP